MLDRLNGVKTENLRISLFALAEWRKKKPYMSLLTTLSDAGVTRWLLRDGVGSNKSCQKFVNQPQRLSLEKPSELRDSMASRHYMARVYALPQAAFSGNEKMVPADRP